uniref:Uncharacterized protein n=1 Tax=Anguilla anguilla TaxID=7936 RepID=A0A0E9TTS0_ANGAN
MLAIDIKFLPYIDLSFLSLNIVKFKVFLSAFNSH